MNHYITTAFTSNPRPLFERQCVKSYHSKARNSPPLDANANIPTSSSLADFRVKAKNGQARHHCAEVTATTAISTPIAVAKRFATSRPWKH